MRNIYTPNYLIIRDGIYYFVRRIPIDIKHHYTVHRICTSLRTRSYSVAKRGAALLTTQLDDYWLSLRMGNYASNLYPSRSLDIEKPAGITLYDALDLYLRLKSKNKGDAFIRYAKRSIDYVIDTLGNRDLVSYNALDGGKFRDALMKRQLASSSVKRIFSSVRSIVNLAIREHGLDMKNPFANVYFPELNDSVSRKPIVNQDIRLLQNKCIEFDDDLRHLLALISDTGMRLAEAAGLHIDDLVLSSSCPHICLKPNPVRRLKTQQSQRIIPLIGASFWAAKRIKDGNNVGYAFDRYTKTGICNSNSASAALNKWLKEQVSDEVVIHSFRHSMRDRLRAVQCPKDIVDAIGGWGKSSIGEQYGNGYPVSVLYEWMDKIALR